MPITEADLVFLESERMDDTAAGGGRMTGTVIADGEENNIFPDIAPTDRVMGRVRLGKVFAANRSADTSLYLGAHLAISHRPVDPAVDVILFAPGSWTDTRTEARDYVERYLARGPYWPGWLYGNHLAGQRAVQIYQLLEVELPSVGQTLILIQDESLANEQEQYVRITKIEEVVRTFIDVIGSFQRRVVTLTISDALRYDFIGQEVERYTAQSPRSRIRDTVAAAAAHYYSTRPLAQAALTGERTVWVDTLYGQLVPSAQTETPLVDLDAAGAALPLTVSGGNLSLTTSAALSPTAALYLGAGIVQGSLSLVTGATTLTDNARGDLLSGATVVGAIDYTEGVLTGVSGGPSYGGSKTITWTPAAMPGAVSLTAGLAVTAETRSLNWTMTLLPIPRPGTLRVDYQVAGKWYRLQDRGDGGLVGATSAHGAGSLSFSTGSVLVTCGALPDVGSEILFFWARAVDTFDRSAGTFDPPKIRTTLAHVDIVPNSLDLSWTVNAVAKAASDNGLGALTGDATGTIDYNTGALVIVPALLPEPGTEISADYQYGPPQEFGQPRNKSFTNPSREMDGSLILALDHTHLVPRSVKVVWNLMTEEAEASSTTPAEMQAVVINPYNPNFTASDNGSGVLVIQGGTNGTVNYAAGTLQFLPDVTVSIPWPAYEKKQIGTTLGSTGDLEPVYRDVLTHWEISPAAATLPPDETGVVTVYYLLVGGGEGSVTGEALTVDELQVDLTKGYAESLIPNATRFLVGGRTYIDRAGVLYYGLDPATGAGTLGGGLDYGSGIAALSAWAGNVAPAQSLKTLLTQLQAAIVDETCFRIAIAPVRPGSLSVRATPLLHGAAAINVTADTDGVIYQAGVCDGLINYATGVVRIRWGGWVNDADLTPEQKTEIWYDPEAVIERNSVDQIFKPRPVYADTVVYNAVGYSYLPLNADLLGLDPVRLPSDGRVPVLQTGDLALILHHHEVVVASPVAGGTVDTTLTGVARVRVFDADGLAVAADRYSLAQDTGIVTWATPLDLTGHTAPYTVEATIEDAALVVDADISGQLTLNRTLTHDFPDGALVASAYLFGDLFAQASTPFAQQAWTSVWSDSRIGNPILAQYNNLLYPIELSNASSWRERWALLFTSTTSFRVIGETLGDITDNLGGDGYHDTSHDLSPVNPLTNTPYFTLAWEGWGSGWVAGNVLRFNILPPANFPAWLALTVQPSVPTTGQDRFRLLLRGGIDA
jgi:hypothetical protein